VQFSNFMSFIHDMLVRLSYLLVLDLVHPTKSTITYCLNVEMTQFGLLFFIPNKFALYIYIEQLEKHRNVFIWLECYGAPSIQKLDSRSSPNYLVEWDF
jgi:hypothetical protein